MELTISQFRDGKRSDEYWPARSLNAAQDRFCQMVRDGELDRMEIRNANGKLIFHYPQEMQSA